MSRTLSRSSRSLGVLALAVAPLASVAVAAPAQAADAYRYWSYYQLGGQGWTFAQTGPDGATPQDGAVEGYRYALGDMSTPRLPRAVVTFDTVCGSTPAAEGKKRVGVVVDFGRAEDAAAPGAQVPQPYAACASVPTAATGAQVLQAVSQVRVEKAMVCGIDGYPATGCSDVVKEVPAPAKAPDQPVTVPVRAAATSAPAQTTSAADSSSANPSPASPSSTSQEESSSGGNGWVTPVLIAALLAAGAGAWAAMRRRGQH